MKAAWQRLWFKHIDVRRYAALRILCGGLCGLYIVQLWPYLPVQFGATGWLGTMGQIAGQNGGSWSLFFIRFDQYNEQLPYLIAGLGVLSAFSLMIGCYSRLSAGVTWLVWVSLWNRNPLLLDGDDAVLKMMCFYLLLSPCGHAWSVDAGMKAMPKRAAVWPLRLVQGQIALLYFVSGWVKFHSVEWEEGTVLQYVLIHPQYARWNGWYLVHIDCAKIILVALADFIRWWEVLFPLLLLHPFTRKVCIVIGILFHLSLALTLNLRWFPVVMLALYPALLPDTVFIRLKDKVKTMLGWLCHH